MYVYSWRSERTMFLCVCVQIRMYQSFIYSLIHAYIYANDACNFIFTDQ